MRVLFDDAAIHVWAPAGHFTVDGDGAVRWHTPDDPLRDHASRLDDEVRVSRSVDPAVLAAFGDALIDAAVLSEGELAVVLAGQPPVLRVFEAPGGALLFELPLTAEGTRAPGFERERFSDSPHFEGFSKRSIRLFDSPHGLVVAANESGHVAHVSLEKRHFGLVIRTPAEPEHDVSGRLTDAGMLVAIVFNHRHIALRHFDDGGELTGAWPETEDDVRWGTPPPVVVGDRVIAYSDEGPHARSLHVLTLPDLAEDAYHRLPDWPTDSALSADGGRFAFLSASTLTVGHMDGEQIVCTSRDLGEMRPKQRGPGGLPGAATDDGKGARRWFDEGLELVTVRRGVPLVQSQTDRNLTWLRDDGSREEVVPADRGVKDFFGRANRVTAPDVLDARDGALLIGGARPRIVDLATGGARPADLSLPDEIEDPRLLAARLLGDGVFRCHEVRIRDVDWRVYSYWTAARGAKELGRWATWRAPRIPFAVGGGAAFYFTLQQDRRDAGAHVEVSVRDFKVHRFTAAMFSVGSYAVKDIPVAIVANGRGALLSVERTAADARTAPERYLVTMSPDGKLARRPDISTAHLDLRFVHGGKLYAIEPNSAFVGEHRAPDRLVRIDLATGERRAFATASAGQFSGLTFEDGKVWWLEGTTGNQALAQHIFATGPKRDAVSCVCSVAVDEI
ncbi:MAG: hypothetical protein U0441_35725 [Polyangiaceae bacterium]